MTAREKFEARLKELGLEDEYAIDDHVGTVLPGGRITVLVHIDDDPKDGYSEFFYPPFEELWKNEKFRQACKEEYYGQSNDDAFVAKLAYWLDIHGNIVGCPLFPVDLYWLTGKDGKTFESYWINYEDDPAPLPAEEIIKNLVAEHSVAQNLHSTKQ